MDVDPGAVAGHLRSDEARPAAPRSWSDSTRPFSTSSRLVSISFFPVKGSPIWTDGRFSCASSPSSWLARTLAPPIPSRPVVAPKRTTRARCRGRGAGDAVRRHQPDAHRVDQAVVAVRLVEDRVAADGGNPDRSSRNGPMPSTARSKCQSGSPKRRPSRSATGRAPMATMSRMIPPTPVAAPWKGSTAEGWLWLSTLNATASPSPRSMTPAFSPGPLQDARAAGGQAAEEAGGMLVRAVLGPEERKDGELEVVRVPAHEPADALQLPIGEPERSMKGLFDDRRQMSDSRCP